MLCVSLIYSDLDLFMIYSRSFCDAMLARVVSAYDCMGEVTPPSFADLGRRARPSAFTRNSQRPGHPRLRHLRLVFRLLRRYPRLPARL